MENKTYKNGRKQLKNILITGGQGFIGKALAEDLVQDGLCIYVLDRKEKQNNTKLKTVKYIAGDTKDIYKFGFSNLDAVIHLGEFSRVEQSFSHIDAVLESNRVGTSRVLSFCLKNNIKLIYAGSSTKFGEQYDDHLKSPYSLTKASNTELIKAICDWHNHPYAIVYFYNVYGPGENRCGEFSTFIGRCEQAYIDSTTIGITAPGTQKRNFTHIYDTIRALKLIILSGQGDGYGIGAYESYSVLEVAKMFGLNTILQKEKPGNRKNARLEIDKTTNLGWRQCYQLDQYIAEIKKLKDDV